VAEDVNAVNGPLELVFDDFERFVCEPNAQIVAEVNVEKGW